MLTKYSIFMMLLIVAASLVGISSSIYQPANVKSQPQQQPQQQRLVPNPGQIVKQPPPLLAPTQQPQPQPQPQQPKQRIEGLLTRE